MFKYTVSAFSSRFEHPALGFLVTMAACLFVIGFALEQLRSNGLIGVGEFTPGFFGVFGVFVGFLAAFGYTAVFVAKYASVARDRFADAAREAN